MDANMTQILSYFWEYSSSAPWPYKSNINGKTDLQIQNITFYFLFRSYRCSTERQTLTLRTVRKCLATWEGRRFSRSTLLIPCTVSTPSSSPFSLSLHNHSTLHKHLPISQTLQDAPHLELNSWFLSRRRSSVKPGRRRRKPCRGQGSQDRILDRK